MTTLLWVSCKLRAISLGSLITSVTLPKWFLQDKRLPMQLSLAKKGTALNCWLWTMANKLKSIMETNDSIWTKPNHYISLKVVGSLRFRKTNHSAHFSNKYEVLIQGWQCKQYANKFGLITWLGIVIQSPMHTPFFTSCVSTVISLKNRPTPLFDLKGALLLKYAHLFILRCMLQWHASSTKKHYCARGGTN